LESQFFSINISSYFFLFFLFLFSYHFRNANQGQRSQHHFYSPQSSTSSASGTSHHRHCRYSTITSCDATAGDEPLICDETVCSAFVTSPASLIPAITAESPSSRQASSSTCSGNSELEFGSLTETSHRHLRHPRFSTDLYLTTQKWVFHEWRHTCHNLLSVWAILTFNVFLIGLSLKTQFWNLHQQETGLNSSLHLLLRIPHYIYPSGGHSLLHTL